MKSFELSLREEIDIYIDSGLTPTELFIVRLLFLAKDGDPSSFINYASNISNGKQLIRQVLISLQQKKIINSTFKLPNEGESLDYDIPFNMNFVKKYIRLSNDLGKELLDEYPVFININGRLVSVKNFTKAGLFGPEEFSQFYAKSIKNASVTHERVMTALRFAKENNIIHYSILEFIASRKWQEIEYLRDSGNVNGYNNTELI